jgi:hypothetical protein
MRMAMIVLTLMTVEMEMLLTVVMMAMHVPPFAVQFERQRPAESYQQDPDAGFSDELELCGDAKPPGEHNRPHN